MGCNDPQCRMLNVFVTVPVEYQTAHDTFGFTETLEEIATHAVKSYITNTMELWTTKGSTDVSEARKEIQPEATRHADADQTSAREQAGTHRDGSA